jgi:N-acetylneuraminic acid mutarotase
VSDGTYIYIVGGADSVGANTNTIWRYDPANNTYNTTLATLTTATWAQAAAYLNGKIYKIAGCGSNCASFPAAVEVYDIATNTWSAAAPLPAAAGWLMATGLGNHVYVAGGTATTETAKTYRYDPNTNTWDDAAIADLPATRWGSSEGVAKGQWRLAGGYSGGFIVNSALSWNPNTNTWNAIDNMPAARARMSGDVVGVDFYSFGGRDPIIGGFNGTTENQKYTDICQSPTATPTPGNILVGHLTVQSVAQPNVRNTLVTPTLTLCVGGVPQSQVLTLDQSAFFTITTGLPNGSYNYSIKWVRGLANAGSLSLSGGTSTHEFGTLRGGDSNNSNIVNSIDFNQLRTAFGTANNLATDFNLDNITNSLDFNILRGNFGVAGGTLACP